MRQSSNEERGKIAGKIAAAEFLEAAARTATILLFAERHARHGDFGFESTRIRLP